MNKTIYVDARCLQDPKYRVRGIGQHLAALLRTRPASTFSSWKTVAVADPLAPELRQPDIASFDEITYSANPTLGNARAVFIDGTPMTHDSHFDLRFMGNQGCMTASVVHDFIPLDWPGYLPTISSRITYIAKMARLRNFDVFFPNSDYTAWRLSEVLGIPRSRMHVTGASVRQQLYRLTTKRRNRNTRSGRYFVIVVAEDARKNPNVVVEAIRRLNSAGRCVSLKVIGHYERHQRDRLLRLAGETEETRFLEFYSDISDEQLADLYSGAVATIAPSYIEGFSLPIVEAAVCGCPVIASTCAAHLELIDKPEALFAADDVSALRERMEALLDSDDLCQSITMSQAQLPAKFHENLVGERFWNGLSRAAEEAQHLELSSRPGKKPHLAFLSPYPPDQSGVARYTAMAMKAGESLFHADLFTDAPRPLAFDGNFRDAGRVSVAPIANGDYASIISVLGNSHFHAGIFEVFERFGGPCILHDVRLVQIYVERLGHAGFVNLATRLLGRPVTMEEVGAWLQEEDPPTLLLEPLVERASPLMVHTYPQQADIKRRYGIDAQVITSCPTIFFSDAELQRPKKYLRRKYGVRENSFLVSSFGLVGPEKGMDTLIIAIELMRSWNIPAELYFVGKAGQHKPQIEHLAWLLDIRDCVHLAPDFVDDEMYRDFLITSDAAIQVRTYAFGQLSAALSDCISAGLPAVASFDLARSCDAPSYVLTVPDRFSPLQLAEALAQHWEAQSARSAIEEQRRAYLETHNFTYYAKRLIQILGLT
jgi:glycosyltransferase involved in cell wall biosynthesis